MRNLGIGGDVSRFDATPPDKLPAGPIRDVVAALKAIDSSAGASLHDVRRATGSDEPQWVLTHLIAAGARGLCGYAGQGEDRRWRITARGRAAL